MSQRVVVLECQCQVLKERQEVRKQANTRVNTSAGSGILAADFDSRFSIAFEP